MRVLSRLFRRVFLHDLQAAYDAGALHLVGSLEALQDQSIWTRALAKARHTEWVVYAKRPFAGPQQVVDYVGRYTHRVAISNNRLLAFSKDEVRFRWRDYAAGNKGKVMTLTTDEFIRRFLLHVLPKGFVRIRHYGFLANRGRAVKLVQLRELLEVPAPAAVEPETVEAFVLRVAGIDIHRCPSGGEGRLIIIEHRPPPHARSPPSRR